MKVVQITRKAAKKEDDQNFWLEIEAAGSSASFNLTAAMANRVTYEPDAGAKHAKSVYGRAGTRQFHEC